MRKQNQSVRVNFSDRGFYFDIKSYKDKVYQSIFEEMKCYETINEKEIVMEYLQNNGYGETFSGLIGQDGYNQVRLNIAILLKEYKFKSVIELIQQDSKYTELIPFFKICDTLYTIAETFDTTQDNVTCIMFIKSKIIQNDDYVKYPILEVFINSFIEVLSDLSSNTSLKTLINVEEIINYVNSKINNSEFDTIVKQTVYVLKELYNLCDPVISFLLTDKDFLKRLKSI
jgi:hypothetical protein